MSQKFRRVVTGLDENGKSSVVIDDDPPANITMPGGLLLKHFWRIDDFPPSVPADGDTLLTTEFSADPGKGAPCFSVLVLPPDEVSVNTGGELPPMHETDSVDLLIIHSGEITLVLETEEVQLKAGDALVQGGVIHTWSNRSDEPCVMFAVTIPAKRQ